jgi:hypothetical protein
MLSIRGNDFIAHWAYEERIIAGWEYADWISSLAEHTRKCLKVKYLGWIKYDFKKSRVTGVWEHKISVSAKKCIKQFHACVPLRIFSNKFFCQVSRQPSSDPEAEETILSPAVRRADQPDTQAQCRQAKPNQRTTKLYQRPKPAGEPNSTIDPNPAREPNCMYVNHWFTV